MIVIADALALVLSGTSNADLPLIGWDNQVTVSNIAATYEDTDYPALNLANPSTVQLWKSTSTATQYLTVTLGAAQEIGFVGIARHNFGTVGATLTVQADPGTASWEDIAGPQIPGDDAPLMFALDPDNWTGVRLKIENATANPQAAVLSIGAALRMPRGLQPGITPFPLGISREFVNGMAQNGDYLGDIQTRARRSMVASFKAIDADWYRTDMLDFVDAARTPFFFAWRPSSYPLECGYAWCTEDPQPVYSTMGSETIDISLKMEGLAL